MNKEDGLKLTYITIAAPCILESFIFQCFHFAEWRNDVSLDIQIRIIWGSLAIACTFLCYYISLSVGVVKSSDKSDKIKQLLSISLFAAVGFGTFLFNFFIA